MNNQEGFLVSLGFFFFFVRTKKKKERKKDPALSESLFFDFLFWGFVFHSQRETCVCVCVCGCVCVCACVCARGLLAPALGEDRTSDSVRQHMSNSTITLSVL